MYLLDTNAISQPLKPKPDPGVMQFIRQTPEFAQFLSVVTIQESRYGINLLPAGLKREKLEKWILHEVAGRFRGRILPITEPVAEEAGRLLAAGRLAGIQPEMGDALIAATARVHHLRVLTLNRKHFEPLGVDLVML